MIYSKEVLRSRLKWVMFGRLFFGVLLMLALFFLERGGPGGKPFFSSPYAPAYWLLTFVCGLNLVYLLLVRWRLDPTHLSVLQVVLDIVLVSLLVYTTGIDRIFVYLYFATVLCAGLLINPAYSFLFASLATVLLSMVSILHYLAGHPEISWKLPLVSADLLDNQKAELQYLVPYLLSVAISLHVVAFLSSLLAKEMNRIRILSQEVVENMAEGVIAVDRTGQVAFINGEAKRMLGLPAERWEGRRHTEVIPRREVQEAVDLTLAQRTRHRSEIEINRVPVEILTSPISDPTTGEARGAVLILSDLTLRKKLEEMGKLQERFGAFVELSTSLAHEVRNPLASIKGASQELAGGDALKEDDVKLLNLLVKEVDRLDKILSSFLEYAVPRPLTLRVCHLSALLEEVAVLLESRARSRGVDVRRQISQGLYCKGDEDRLKQVFLNIGINAIEALPASGGRIVLRGTVSDHQTLVEIEDNGSGIPPDVLHRVFDPFFTTKDKGTGMGLAVARKIVQSHEGRIALESEVGAGTRCRVWLPMSPC
jgi:PAS domain S-box-containing protein